jgi:hypothetical protein
MGLYRQQLHNFNSYVEKKKALGVRVYKQLKNVCKLLLQKRIEYERERNILLLQMRLGESSSTARFGHKDISLTRSVVIFCVSGGI